jgi:hypothetical protein
MVYSDTQVLVSSSRTTIFNRGHHTEITVSTVIGMHPPNHGHSKRHTTSFSIHPRIEFGRTRSAAHVWCSFFVPVPYLTAEIQVICLFYTWSNQILPWGKCHFSANIAEVIWVIYALPGQFYKYTTQSMTVECQLKISQQNSRGNTIYNTTAFVQHLRRRVDRQQFSWSRDEHVQQR